MQSGEAGLIRRSLEDLSVMLHDIAESLDQYRGSFGVRARCRSRRDLKGERVTRRCICKCASLRAVRQPRVRRSAKLAALSVVCRSCMDLARRTVAGICL